MTGPSGGSNRKSLRASDQDREHAAEVLREAAGEGRLSSEELDERLDAVYAAKTYTDLEPIIQDLPHTGPVPPPAPTVASADSAAVDRFGGEPTSSAAIAIMGGFSRKGAWVVPANFTAVAIMAGGELDLREARFAERVVQIHATAIMGVFVGVVSAACFGGGVGNALAHPHRPNALGALAISLAASVVLGAVLIRTVRSATLIASRTGVTVRSVARTRRWAWSDIRCFEEVVRVIGIGGYPRRTLLIHLADGQKRLLTELNESPRRAPDSIVDLTKRLNGMKESVSRVSGIGTSP